MSSMIDYEALVQESLRNVVSDILKDTAQNGLPGAHHFYVSFDTNYPGVDLPDYLREQYPEEITIVLQYEFWDLEVEDDRFYITLCFNDVHERLTIPFASIISFVDPSVKFGLQFSPSIHDEDAEETEATNTPEKITEKPAAKKAASKKKTTAKSKGKKAKKGDPDEGPDGDGNSPLSNVVTLDSFRKNTKKQQKDAVFQ